MAALITLCNQALGLIAAGDIASLGETAVEAKYCNRFAQPLLDEMIGWSESFGFGRSRVLLASVTNDRPAEWLYAYAVPSDVGTSIAIRAVEDDAYGLPTSGPYTFPLQDALPLAFVQDGNRVYTNVETATLIYSRKTIDASELSALGQRAFVDELAARLAMPVKKANVAQVQALRKQAEISRARWVADEENKTPRNQARYISEAEYARGGYL